MTASELKDYCNEHTPQEAADLLKEFADEMRKDSSVSLISTREMCGIASYCYYNKYGGNWSYMDFYQYMWSYDELPSAEDRKQRHLSCGFELDK